MSGIPEPKDTGSSGTQEQGSLEVVSVEPTGALDGLPLAQTLEGLANTHSRSFGGEVGSRLLVASVAHIHHDLESTSQELVTVRGDLDRARSELATARERVAVLRERLRGGRDGKKLKNLSLVAGTALIGIAIEFYRSDLDKFSYLVGALGLLLLVFGWITSDGNEDDRS